METHDHFPTEILLDYLENRGDEETRARVAAHLDTGCARCAGEIAAWTRLLATLSACAAAVPPEEVVQRALDIFERAVDQPAPSALPASAPRPLSPAGWRARIMARLTFDSRVQPALSGARDASTSFQLLFEAEGTEINLLCERHDGSWRITGQALSGDIPLEVRGVSAATTQVRAEAEKDAQGEFHLSGLPPGVYEIVLREADREIVLPDVRLQCPAP
jgi:hypothetical protein